MKSWKNKDFIKISVQFCIYMYNNRQNKYDKNIADFYIANIFY